MMYDEPSDTQWDKRAAETWKQKRWRRFTDAMSEEQVRQTLTPYALDRATGFYVKVRNVEGLLQDAGVSGTSARWGTVKVRCYGQRGPVSARILVILTR